ncbi:MAG TPA: alpha/beta hydrolase [Candidatus Binataceae bacterium]|nr:alpha/beta hydrolase [Candidatus Binataceae bacterium]
MYIDPQMKALLDMANSAPGARPFHDMTPVEARQAAEVMFAAFRAGAKAVAKVTDMKIPGPAGEIPIRVYTPAGTGPFGCLVFFHGGGWVIGSIETHDTLCRELTVGAGVVTVSVDYRLAPEHKFPAAPEDCYAATKCAYDSAKSINVDPNRIAVGGDSAGGNLAAVVSQMARDRGGPKIAYQYLIYPATDCSDETPSQREFALDGYILSRADMEWFYGHYLNAPDKTNPYACPGVAKNLAGLPPAFVITASIDPLRDEGETYAEALRKAGVQVKAKRYEGVCHGFLSMASMVDLGKQAIADSCAELRAAIGR